MAKKDLKKYSELTPQQQQEFHSKGGKASAKSKKEKKTLSELAKIWCEMEVSDPKQKETLKKMGIENPTNKSIILLSLIKNLNITRASSRTIEQFIELLNEDKEKEARIKKLELENERLQKELNGELMPSQIMIVNDIPENKK